MKNGIHGWYRLGIVLSAVWVVSLVAYVVYESQRSEFEKRYFFDSIPSLAYHSGTSDDPIPLESKFRLRVFFIALSIPLIVGWLPAVGLAIVRWVRRGFEHEEEKA